MTTRRKGHVYRIYQTDADGNVVDEDIWVDVLRIDVFSVILSGFADGNGQRRVHYTDWKDDGARSVRERVMDNLNVINPTDPTISIDVPIIHRTRIILPNSQSGARNQALKLSFRNKVGISVRRFKKVRVYNNDLASKITMPPVKAGQPQPLSQTSGRGLGNISYDVPWGDYADALQSGSQDKDQYVDAEILTDFAMIYPRSSDTGGGQVIRFHLHQVGINPVGVASLFDAPPNGSTGTIYRLDPFQTIVNVSWKSLAVEFFDRDT